MAPIPAWAWALPAVFPILNEIPESNRLTFEKAMQYMGYENGTPMLGKPVDYVFVGSCTNGRIEDLREFASFVKGKKKAPNVTAWIVPGSKQVEKQALAEGIDKMLAEAGFELRQPGCSACLAMNDDKIPEGKYAVSTSNRNFEGTAGPGCTHPAGQSPYCRSSCHNRENYRSEGFFIK